MDGWRCFLAGLLAAGLLAGASIPRPARAEGGGAVRIHPAEQTIALGGTAAVEVWLEGAEGFYGLDLRLAWDPAVAVAAEGGVEPLWEVFDPGSHITLKNQAGWCDDQSGQRWYGAWYAVANVSPAQPFSGSGRVCAIRLTGRAPGTVALAIPSAEGATNAGARLSPAAVGATIIVALATATPSPSPTGTPTATATAVRTATPSLAVAAPASPIPSPTPRPSPTALRPTATALRRTATALPTRTPTPGATPSRPPEPLLPHAGQPPVDEGLLRLLLPFLLGAVVTAGVLRVVRGRGG